MDSDDEWNDDIMMQEVNFGSRREQRRSQTSERPSIKKSEKYTPDEKGFDKRYDQGKDAGLGTGDADCQGCVIF